MRHKLKFHQPPIFFCFLSTFYLLFSPFSFPLSILSLLLFSISSLFINLLLTVLSISLFFINLFSIFLFINLLLLSFNNLLFTVLCILLFLSYPWRLFVFFLYNFSYQIISRYFSVIFVFITYFTFSLSHLVLLVFFVSQLYTSTNQVLAPLHSLFSLRKLPPSPRAISLKAAAASELIRKRRIVGIRVSSAPP